MTPLETCKSLFSIIICLIFINVITCYPKPEPVSGLSYGFYKSSCPKEEEIIREEMGSFLEDNITSVGGFLHIPYHDCFVQVNNKWVEARASKLGLPLITFWTELSPTDHHQEWTKLTVGILNAKNINLYLIKFK